MAFNIFFEFFKISNNNKVNVFLDFGLFEKIPINYKDFECFPKIQKKKSRYFLIFPKKITETSRDFRNLEKKSIKLRNNSEYLSKIW